MKHPPLLLWRLLTPGELECTPEVMPDLVAFLTSRLTPRTEDERALLDQMLRGDGYQPSLLLAVRFLGRRRPRDVAMTLVLLSALRGSSVAAVALAQSLLHRARSFRHLAQKAVSKPSAVAGRHRREARRSLRLSLAWLASIRSNVLEATSRWEGELASLSRVGADPIPSAPTEDEPSSQGESGPTLTVLKEIGDPDTEAGRELSTAYNRLLQPLPLKGGDVDLLELETMLSREFPHLRDAIDHVLGDLRLQRYVGRRWLRLRPMLLLGPPGVGKTRFAKRLAALLQMGYGEVNGAGSSDDRALRGTARGWRNAQPSLPLITMARTECGNPIVLVDELDKAGGSERNGDIRQTLLSFLESETAATAFDEALLAPVDLSQVSWISTANDVAGLSAPLRSRVAVIHCPRPAAEDFEAICQSVLSEIARSLDVAREVLPSIDPIALARLRDLFISTGDVRRLRRAIEAVLGAAALSRRKLH